MLFYKHKDKLMFFYKHKYKLMFFLKIQRQSWWSSENTKNRKMYFCNIKQKKSWLSAWQTQIRKARQKIISVKLVSGIFLIVTTAQSCLSPDIHYKVCCWWPGKSQRCATSTVLALRGATSTIVVVLLALLSAVPGFFADCPHICYYPRSRVHTI